MHQKYLAWLVLALLAGGAALLWTQRSSKPPALSSAPCANCAAVSPFYANPAASAALKAGVDADQQFEVDAQGQLRVTVKTRRIFDAYWDERGVEPRTSWRARIDAAIHAQLKEPAATQASTLLAHYIDLREALDTMEQAPAASPQYGGVNLGAILQIQKVTNLRKQTLGADVAQIFYGDDEAYQRYMLARQQLLQMSGLNEQQRQEQLSTLRQELPPAVRDQVPEH